MGINIDKNKTLMIYDKCKEGGVIKMVDLRNNTGKIS